MIKLTTDKPRALIMQAVTELEALVKQTYGPAGKGVLIDSGHKQEIADDGYTVLEAYEPKDELQAAVIKYLRETARKTNSRAGDGTTTSFLLLASILKQIYGDGTTFGAIDNVAITHELREGVANAVNQLRAMAKKVETKEELALVAMNSYSNAELANMIADAVFAVGKEGGVTVQETSSLETKVKITNGMSFDKGFVSAYMATNEGGLVAEMQDADILITDTHINAVMQIVPIIEKMMAKGRRQLILIAEEIEGEALATMIVNKLKGTFSTIAIKAPGYGTRKQQYFQDLALVTGATFISEQAGKSLMNAELTDLGKAKKVVVTNESTVIIDGAGDKKAIEASIEALRVAPENESSYDKGIREERIAKLTGGVAVIQVGAATETEAKSMKLKVDDAVNATRLAFRDGVVEGGGMAFKAIETHSLILNTALQRPRAQLIENGESALTDTAVDPTGVAVAALESAVSVAISFVNCGGIIAPKREEPKNQ